ncbi:uncharacterized protein LOC111694203 [Trichogramma pretiosum]|uniref:uncharacterized protein LOC111694203 n=1 Tax=Trichogramma pretiosum TaxID=7493 RepID=UPI000C71A2AC|nr:uncharacterized protein LOC111694203 [Trichogramma pretiosum]
MDFRRLVVILAITFAVIYSVNCGAFSDEIEDNSLSRLDDEGNSVSIETYDFWSKLRDKALKILKKHFRTSEKCLKEAAKQCAKKWYNPKKLIKCANDLFTGKLTECLIEG